jgi:hypothetical protein
MILRSASPAIAAALLCLSTASVAGTFGELSAARALQDHGPAVQPPACPPYCPLPMRPPAVEDGRPAQAAAAAPYLVVPVPAPTGYPPFGAGPAGAPGGPIPIWSFGQITSMSNPYDPWGLNTPFMRVPWSTPMSGWTNAAAWNWWRERSGAPPSNW